MDQNELLGALQKLQVQIGEVIRLLAKDGSAPKSASGPAKHYQTGSAEISFDLSTLAFMNKHGKALPGPQKFALLVACLAKGSMTKEISAQEVKKHWNKMKTIMSTEYNAAHANRARAAGWVDSPKHGIYILCHSWKESLARK
jgi:hypothetical protein